MDAGGRGEEEEGEGEGVICGWGVLGGYFGAGLFLVWFLAWSLVAWNIAFLAVPFFSC